MVLIIQVQLYLPRTYKTLKCRNMVISVVISIVIIGS